MLVSVVDATKRIASMVADAAIVSERKHNVILFVITDPVTTAIGLNQIFSLATEPTAGAFVLAFLAGLGFIQLPNLAECSLSHDVKGERWGRLSLGLAFYPSEQRQGFPGCLPTLKV